MSRARRSTSARPSVLDRLLVDPAQGWGDASGMDPEASVEGRKRAVQRDLEWLLNTRRTSDPAPTVYRELQDSVYHYGLPDLTSRSADDPAVRSELVRDVENTIRRFEPRLTQVRATLVGAAEGGEHAPTRVRFRIDALLRLDPNPVRVQFDTRLEVASGTFHVDVPDDDA
jgi:type VI secretion system protein ImpF